MKKCAIALSLGAAAGKSIEVISSDLRSSNRGIDNIKAEWSQGLSLFGNDATLGVEYDRNANSDFVKEVTLSGSVDKVTFEYTNTLDGSSALSLETSTDDGTTISCDLTASGSNIDVDEVSASRSTSLGGQSCELTASHLPGSGESKLKLSTVLGAGVTGTGEMTIKGGDTSTNYEIEYEAALGSGRELSASMNPSDGTGEVEYTDTSTIDEATITATMPLGGKPTVTVSRSWDF